MSAATTTLAAEKSDHGTRSLTALYFASFIALGLSTGALGPTLLTLAAQTRSSISDISYLFTLRSLGYVCGALRSGKLFDRHPGNMVMAALILTAAICLFAVARATGLMVLLALMFALGVVEAGIDVGANTLLVRVHRDRVAPFMNAMHAFFGVGALTAPLIVAAISQAGHAPRQTYVSISLLLLPIAAASFGIQSPAEAPGRLLETGPPEVGRTVALVVVFFFLYVGSEVGFAGWIFTYAVTTKIGSVTAAAYLTSVFWGALTVGRFVVIPLTTRLRPTQIIVGGLSSGVLSLLVILLPLHSLILLLASTAILGFSMAPMFPVMLSFVSNRMKLTGRVTGWFVVGASLGATILPLLIGQLLNSVGPSVTILVPLVALTFAVATFRLINHRLASNNHDCRT